MFYVLCEKSLLVLKSLLLLPVKHAQINFHILFQRYDKKGTNARDFLNHFSKTADLIFFFFYLCILFPANVCRFHRQLFNAECFCVSLLILEFLDLALDNQNSSKTWGMATGPAHPLKELWKAKTRINVKRTVNNHFPDV